MDLITIERARAHCRADGFDDEILTVYANAAERACARRANRNVYKDDAARNAALDALPAKMTAAFADYETAMTAAAAIANEDERKLAEYRAQAALDEAKLDHFNTVNSIVVTDDYIAAVLLTLGHFYRNREEVVAGMGAQAVQLPFGAQAILDLMFKVGDV